MIPKIYNPFELLFHCRVSSMSWLDFDPHRRSIQCLMQTQPTSTATYIHLSLQQHVPSHWTHLGPAFTPSMAMLYLIIHFLHKVAYKITAHADSSSPCIRVAGGIITSSSQSDSVLGHHQPAPEIELGK